MNLKKHLTKALLILFSFLSVLALSSAIWYTRKYGDTGFMSIISTFLSPWKGCANSLVESYCLYALIPSVAVTILISVLLFYRGRILLKWKNRQLYPFSRKCSITLSLVSSLVALSLAMTMVHFPAYVYDNFLTYSTLYEDEYVDPSDVKITFPEQKRNLVYIYLESMETSFLSEELGGGSKENLIPELYELATEHLNFSHFDGVGGYPRVTHATWTSAAMVSHTAGVPLTIDISQIDLADFKGYLPGATTLQDILHEAGYYQALMVGSDASFGGRKEYYLQHHTDCVYDLYTARDEGLIPEDYMVWWGFEDSKLFTYAKSKISEIALGEQPFAFTLLTVDTHHIDGYFCDYCKKDHSEQYANVLSCSSRQVLDFVTWLKEQPFYENTTVIISGDHPSMDQQYFSRNIEKEYERHVYNCFLNVPVEPIKDKNRYFTPMDFFPTTLVALGCHVEGDRLGLGTNLFSQIPTLAERMGIDWLNREISKRSEYYNTQLIPEK